MAVSGRYRVAKPTKPGYLRRSRRLLAASKERSLVEETVKECGLPSPKSEEHLVRQGKREREEEVSQDTAHDTPKAKRRRSATEADGRRLSAPTVTQNDLVQSWVSNESEWATILKQTTTMSDRSSRLKKRPSSGHDSPSRASSSGGSKKDWGNQHAEEMHEAGLIMDEVEGVTMSQDCQKFCKELLAWETPLPDDWFLKETECRRVLREAGLHNERRVDRDVPPIISPSPELLSVRGYHGLEHIKEGLDVEWRACTNLCETKPKPDGTYGISRKALTPEEKEKLKSSTTAENEGFVFPFFVRQAKRGDGSMVKADRQAMHNSSVACNTMVELYDSIQAAEELDGQVLAFSMSHNHETVRICAHFPVISSESRTFHRQLIFEINLSTMSSDFTRPYKITLGILRLFYPIHLRRIKDALARRSERSIESFTAQFSIDEDDEEDGSSPSSSQEGRQSKKQSLMTTVTTKEQNARLLEAMGRQSEEARQQMEEAHQQRLVLERQLMQMQEDARQHREEARQQKEEARQQRLLLERQLEQMQEDAHQQKKEAGQQKEEARQQREDLRQQLAQQQTIIDLLQGKK